MDELSEPSTLKEKIERLDINLDKYISEIYDNPNITDYLSYSYAEIHGLTPEKANEISAELSAYNWHIQKAINKNLARLSWCERELDRILGKEAKQYDVWNWNEKRLRIIGENIYASKLYNYITKYKLREIALSHHTFVIKALAEDIRRVGFSKLNRV